MSAESTRDRIVTATARLLDEAGHEAVSTRAVAAAADVQAPTIYRLFGDKQGLLDAVAVHGFTTYLQAKPDRVSDDPVQDLRDGWDAHIGFGIAHPAVYALMYAGRPAGEAPPAAEAAGSMLTDRIRRIAQAGRLRVGEEQAVDLVHAAGSGVTLSLIAMPEERRDLKLSTLARDAIVAAITTDTSVVSEPGPAGAAVALRAVLPRSTALTASERKLLTEWLDRIVDGGHR